MKPGKPLWFGVLLRNDGDDPSLPRRTYVFGLPGNPVSSLACFELFVRPLLQVLEGRSAAEPLQASLTTDFTVKGDRPVYQPAFISPKTGQLTATPIPWSSSSDLRATVEANGMIELLPEHGKYESGCVVRAWLGEINGCEIVAEYAHHVANSRRLLLFVSDHAGFKELPQVVRNSRRRCWS